MILLAGVRQAFLVVHNHTKGTPAGLPSLPCIHHSSHRQFPPGNPSSKPIYTPRFIPRRQRGNGEGLTQIHRPFPSLHQSHLGDFEIFLNICPK